MIVNDGVPSMRRYIDTVKPIITRLINPIIYIIGFSFTYSIIFFNDSIRAYLRANITDCCQITMHVCHIRNNGVNAIIDKTMLFCTFTAVIPDNHPIVLILFPNVWNLKFIQPLTKCSRTITRPTIGQINRCAVFPHVTIYILSPIIRFDKICGAFICICKT